MRSYRDARERSHRYILGVALCARYRAFLVSTAVTRTDDAITTRVV